MSKIGIIIAREYFQRIRNKWFLVMTILGPLLIAGLMIVPVWLAIQSTKNQKILVVDETHLFLNSLQSTKNVEYINVASTQAQGEAMLTEGDFTGMILINKEFTTNSTIQLKYKKEPSRATVEYLKSAIEAKYFEYKLKSNNIPDSVIKVAKGDVIVAEEKLKDDGKSEDKSYEAKVAIGIGLSVFIYMFIFLYGMQIMRGVMEEKTSRIVEVIISSVKPFQLMMGKIIGIALVGLTQFILWVILSLTLTTVLNQTVLKDMRKDSEEQKENLETVFHKGSSADFQNLNKIGTKMPVLQSMQGVDDINFLQIILCFGFYFLAGYLFYGALFAAMGSAVDTEADTQQFMLPVTIPLIIGFVFANYVALNPNSDIAFWLSVIPFTSPIIMMVRLPLGEVPSWQLALSMISLILGFICTTWVAGKVYRTGILMYGKKPSWKELGKWLFYKS